MFCINIAHCCSQIFFQANQYDIWGIETHHEPGKTSSSQTFSSNLWLTNTSAKAEQMSQRNTQCLAKPALSSLSVRAAQQGKALSSYPLLRVLAKRKKRIRKRKEDHGDKWHREGTRVSPALLPSSVHLCRGNIWKKNSVSASEGFLLAGNHTGI